MGQGRSALCNPRILKQSICHVIAIIHHLSVGTPLTTRVVDPLSLATIADSIMVEVEDLNHYGVGLFDFASEALVFSLALRLARRGEGKGVPPFGILIS